MGANDRNTRTLDREELAKLARESLEAKEVDEAEVEAEDAVARSPENPPPISRTATLQDPMTMALLAEVTRNARTQEFDPEEMPEHEDTPVHPHPNIRRRST